VKVNCNGISIFYIKFIPLNVSIDRECGGIHSLFDTKNSIFTNVFSLIKKTF